MSDSKSQWLLKVIAGPHQGAEIDLIPGKTLVGSDEGCDVVLHDVLIAPQHMAVEAAPKALFVEPLGGRVYVAGRRVKDTRMKIDPFVFITIGGTHLVLGPAEGKWPLLSASDAPELEKEAPEAPAEEAKAEPASSKAGESSTPEAAAAEPTQGPPKRAVAIFGLAFGLLLLTAWLVLFNIWKGNNPLPGGNEAADLKNRAEEVLKFHKVADSVSVETEGGRLYARGYVEKSDQLRDIEIDLRNKASGVNPRIWSLESLAESARSILRLQRLPLDVTANNEGRLMVSGSVTDRDLWNRVKQQLVDGIPGVTGVDSQVQVPAIVKPEASTVVITLPAASRESREHPSSAPTAAAPPVPTPAPAATPTAAVPTPAPLVAAPPPKALFPTIDKADATVEFIQVRAGGLSSMRLSSGGVYFSGARLPFGGQVLSIKEGVVSITTTDGEVREVKVGDRVRLTAEAEALLKSAALNIATIAEATSKVPPAAPVAAPPAVVIPPIVVPAVATNEPLLPLPVQAPPSATTAPDQKAGESALKGNGSEAPIAAEPGTPNFTVLPALPVNADFSKPPLTERQKAIQEALEAAIATEPAPPLPTGSSQTQKSATASSQAQKKTKP